MNRSRRRATVITWAIAASVLHGGAGLAVAGVAAADPAASGEPAGDQGGAERAAHDKSVDRVARSTGTPGVTRRPQAGRTALGPAEPVRDGSRGRHDSVAQTEPTTRDPAGEVTEEWPCPWWPIIWPDVHPPPDAAHDPRGFTPVVIDGFPPALAAAYSAGVPAAQPGFGPMAPGEYFVDLSPVTAQPPNAVAGASARPALAASVPPAGSPAARPRVAPLSGRPGPSVGAPPPLRPDSVGKPSESVLPGYQEALRAAEVGVLAAAALPGLAAIAGLTALGGFLGYRQARAGYLLRAAGAGRFLQ